MKLHNLFLLLLCLIEIYAQRIRTTNTNQDVSTQEPKTTRGRGRSRFSATQELPETSERPTSNRRASTRTRIHSNNPKAAAERRTRPTTEAPKAYAVEEFNNDSPIDSFIRQSKSRVLTESRFEIPTVTASRRSQTFQSARPPLPTPIEELPVKDLSFGSTARAILQARGETLPPKTTTPVIDEAYLLNNFGSTIRALAAARNEVPIQRATPLRSEVSILEEEDIPFRRPSLRGDALPSLRGSDISVERRPSSRIRNRGQATVATERPRSNNRIESQRKTTEAIPVEDIIRAEPETEVPETVQGIFEQSESLPETQQSDTSGEPLEPDEEDFGKSLSVESETEPPVPRTSAVNSRRNDILGRIEATSDSQPTAAPKARASRTRAPQKTVEIYTAPSTRSRNAKRKYDDAVVAESRSRGPSIFTAEQYTQEVTSRSRTGRRIDNSIESVPERITVDLTSFTTARTRSAGRRATTTRTTSDITSGRDRNGSRGRGRVKLISEKSNQSLNKHTESRKPSNADDTVIYGDRTSNKADIIQTAGRRETNSRLDVPIEVPLRRETSSRTDSIENRAAIRSNSVETPLRRETGSRRDAVETRPAINRSHSVEPPLRRQSSTRRDAAESKTGVSRGNSVEAAMRETGGRRDASESRATKSRAKPVEIPTNRRGTSNRADTINSRSRATEIANRRQIASKIESVEPINIISSRGSSFSHDIPDEPILYGEKSSRTKSHSPEITTIIEEDYVTTRSKSRFSEPKIDESRLEVLPLFEREVKSVPSTRSRGHRSRSSVNSRQNLPHDHMHVSATENDVKFIEKPTTNAFTKVTVTRTESVEASTSRTRFSTRTADPTTSTSTTETTRPTSSTTTTKPTEPSTTRKWVTRPPPLIKESVVAEVNEVTSKSTITRRKKVTKAKAAEMLSRGTKKAEVKLPEVGKKPSSEEIDEEDNYPEPFKALIQAKKKQDEPRPSQSSTRSALAPSSITSTEKVYVTSAASARGSSAARVVTTELPTGKRTQFVNGLINDNENELDPKPTITSTTPIAPTRSAKLRQLPKFSEKPKYTQKPREKYTKPITEKPRYSSEKGATKTTATPKKNYTSKSYVTRDPVEHHYRRKALRSTAFPPSTTPLNSVNREAKFSAKFIRKETKNAELNEAGKSPKPKGILSKNAGVREVREEGGKTGKNASLIQTPKPSLPIKKFNSSRYSSRYRGDSSQRSTVLRSTTSAPFYIPTIPTPAYIPTVPTVTPSVTPVDGIVAVKDRDLGLEVISFDDPVNTIPSADLVNGEYLTTDKNLRLLPMVKDGTTEKPVSIIERIINSITLISTTVEPNTTTINFPSSTSIGAMENSAILKLAPKKPTTKDKTIPDDQTNIIETITSEKPTTIIEKIRSSLSAIQSNEVGTLDFNSVSGPSTTPLSTVTKYSAKFRGSSVGTTSLPAPLPLSTSSINPLSVFEEIDENQVLEKRTIGKLLSILNGLVSTNSPDSSEKLVVVTPKSILNTNTSPKGFVATTYSSQEPLEAIALNEIELESRSSFNSARSSESSETSIVNTDSTTSGSTVYTESSTPPSIVNTESSTVGTETLTVENTQSSSLGIPMNTDATAESTPSTISLADNSEVSTPTLTQTDAAPTQSSTVVTTDLITSSSSSSLTTTANALEASANPLSNDISTTSTSTSQESTTTEISETTTLSDTVTTTTLPPSIANADGYIGSTIYTFPSTLPTIPNIEVSPGSVSIFSANDLSNFITPDDNLFNTVTIASRIGFDNNVLTASTTSTSTPTEGVLSTTTDLSTSTEGPTVSTSTETAEVTFTLPTATVTDGTTISSSTGPEATTILSTTEIGELTTILTTTVSSNTSNSNVSANSPILSNRSGRLLSSDIGEPVGNSIDISTPSTTTSTTPDYFIFAILNNNTILRKRPPTIPNKDTPFLIVGLYPNNTVVRKFPNGTEVPMEQIIQVRGFDTRPNPPPLVEITSNQVTDTTNGMNSLDSNSVTVESNRMGRLLDNDQSVDLFQSRIGISSTTSNNLSSTSTTSTTTNEPTLTSTANSLPSMTSMGSTSTSNTAISENSVPSTTTPGTTMSFISTLPSSTTSQGTTSSMASNIVEILAVPGETRISKAQTTTAEPDTVPPTTVQTSTIQAPSSTIAQSTETIPPTLSEILNVKTVDALANLLTNVEITTAKAPFFKNLEVNQNSLSSTTTVQSTTTGLSTGRNAPFTSPTLSTESETQSTSADRLLSSTLISTLLPATTTFPETTTQKETITSTTQLPTTRTTTMRTTTPEIKTTTQNVETNTQRLTTTVVPRAKTTLATKTTTGLPVFSPSTILPTILTTLFPNFLRNAVTTPSSPLSSTRKLFTSAEFPNTIGDRFEFLSTAATTARPTTISPQTSSAQRISTTTPLTTTTRQTTTQTTTQFTTTTQTVATTIRPKPTTTESSISGTPTPSTKEETDALFDQLKNSGKLKNLNEEQRKNLEEIEKIEKEQAELLKQLTLLTTMFRGPARNLPNLPPLPNNNPVGGNSNNLANRVIAMAMERDRTAHASTVSPQIVTTKTTTKRPNSIQDQLPVSQQTVDVTQRTTPSLEDILKQYNLNGLSTPVPLSSTYGKTDEALLAAILKEQGIGPTTPKILADKVKEAGIFEENPTIKTSKPKTKPRTTTTARPIGGRLMQGLNWLLDILDPPTTKRPTPKKSKPKTQPPKENSGDEELLSNQPTRITPIVTAAPVTKPNLSQEEIQALIKQLEAVQGDPTAADQLDFSKIKSLQNLINVNEGVHVTSAGQHGATSRATPRPPRITSTTEKDPFLTEINKKTRSSTVSTLSVSNSIDDDVELIPTTTRTRVLPPVSLNPIPGIDNQGDSLIRSNLLTAAVNVTRAISDFLGSALQGASRGFRSLIGSGSAMVGNIAQTSRTSTG